MTGIFAAVATGALGIYGFLYFMLHYTQNLEEPHLISNFIPFFSTLIQLARKKDQYYTELSKRYDLPIYTLRLPGAKLYIVNSVSLISAVQRQSRKLAFSPIKAIYARRICGLSQVANDALQTNVNGDEGDWGFSITGYKMIHRLLAAGPELDAMNQIMAQKVAALVDCVKDGETVPLFDFIKRELALATTESVYGPQNPFKDPKVADGFWKFQTGVTIFILGFFPTLFAREASKAREYMTRAFHTYLKSGGHDSASALIQCRVKHGIEYKIPLEDIARFEVGDTLGLLTSTIPAAFWTVYHICSTPDVLEECRKELSKIIVKETYTETDGSLVALHTLDMSNVKISCPLLWSTLQEVLRIYSVEISVRMVMEDHILDDKYLLKKGSRVLMPAAVQHTNMNTWGPNVDNFDHHRFLPQNKRHNPTAFRGFGGGTSLCAGRHFATTEILIFAALLILRFDIIPADGQWVPLTTNKAAPWEATPGPDADIAVRITARPGQQSGVRWKILVSDSDKIIPLSVEDL